MIMASFIFLLAVVIAAALVLILVLRGAKRRKTAAGYKGFFDLACGEPEADAPIAVRAGDLRKRGEGEPLLAFLTLESLSERAVAGVTVELFCLDSAGDMVGEPILYEYRDAIKKSGVSFGQKQAILIEDPAVVGYEARIKRVAFCDGGEWPESEVRKSSTSEAPVQTAATNAPIIRKQDAALLKKRRKRDILITVSAVAVFLLSYFVAYPQIARAKGNYAPYIKIYNVQHFTIPEGVTEIRDKAFFACSELRSVTIPEGVTTIGESAFAHCEALTSITIPTTIETIGENAFTGCQIDAVTAPAHVFAKLPQSSFYSVVINGGDVIPERAFSYATNLTSVKIEEGVRAIGNAAFHNCASLQSIQIPASVLSIGRDAFYGCSGLLHEEAGVIYAGEWAVGHVDGLDRAHIREGTVGIADCAFYDNFYLSSVEFPGGLRAIGKYAFDDCSLYGDLVLPDSLVMLGEGAFYGSNITSVTIPSGVTTLESSVFRDCNLLTSATLPEGLTRIGSHAFGECKRLLSVNVPTTVTEIGAGAFASCEALTAIELPAGLTVIDMDAFGSCTGLTSITIPDSVTSLGGHAFAGCTSLVALDIPASVTSLEASTFMDCDVLSAVNVHADNPAYRSIDGVLYSKDGKTLILYPIGKTDTALVIPEGVEEVGSIAIYQCTYLESITLPSTLKTIGESAFSNSNRLQSIVIPAGVTEIKRNAFWMCYSMTSLVIADGVGAIGESAFANCDSLVSVTIPGSVTTIGKSAFEGCEKLESVRIEPGVGAIGESAFAWCDNLQLLMIPNTVMTIGTEAFLGCYRLTMILTSHTSAPVGWDTGGYTVTWDACAYDAPDSSRHTFEDGGCIACGVAEPRYTREGNTIYFGEYPQSRVTDSELQSTLTAKAGILPTSADAQAWTSYGYYVNGSVSSYMWYIDVTEDGARYRGVYFTSYRPYSLGSSSSSTYQDDNGYATGTVYWFRYEPIAWTVLSEGDGKAMLLCNMIIDSQAYDYENGTYSNNYAESTIRAWLNDAFYNTAFSDLQRSIILTTTVDNSAESTDDRDNPYVCEDTEDQVFLLSHAEVTNSAYGFSSGTDRQKQTTDYAQAQGAYTYSGRYDGNGYWWLRSPYDFRGSALEVYDDGNAYKRNYVYYTSGVVPALRITLN